ISPPGSGKSDCATTPALPPDARDCSLRADERHPSQGADDARALTRGQAFPQNDARQNDRYHGKERREDGCEADQTQRTRLAVQDIGASVEYADQHQAWCASPPHRQGRSTDRGNDQHHASARQALDGWAPPYVARAGFVEQHKEATKTERRENRE